MNRRYFLQLTGMSAGAFVLANCLSSCKKEDNNPAISVDFTIDLSDSNNAALNVAGGFIYKSGVIVAKTIAGNFIAVASACTHQGTTITYQGNSQQFHCPNHGSNFAESGSVINGPATEALQKFNTSLNGNLLRVFS